ncbi:hypothetical protein NDU88_002465 [Pleurodeles waltl]|uniref:Uncharacterized protein n=1 Tax=Pleurodeles waltl TaxID=8319 RepID=A0AAV7W0R0_PLEWA|nr:hypothetical protein NDU88_002465 [Pleurodeles waltl]
MVATATATYFTENEGTIRSTTNLWKAYIAVMCCQMIARRIGLKRDREMEGWELEGQLLQLEAYYVATPDGDLPHNTGEVRQEYEALVSQEARTQFRATQGRMHEVGNRLTSS